MYNVRKHPRVYIQSIKIVQHELKLNIYSSIKMYKNGTDKNQKRGKLSNRQCFHHHLERLIHHRRALRHHPHWLRPPRNPDGRRTLDHEEGHPQIGISSSHYHC